MLTTLPGFKVEWKLKQEDGTVSPGTSLTDGTGKTRASWTMPDQARDNAVLEAHITDKEGDHLKGSPLVFSTKVLCKDPISMSFLGLSNHKVTPGEEKTVKEYSMDFKFTDPCNMIGQAKQAILLITWTNDSDGKPHPGQIDLKNFGGQATFNVSAGGSVWWFYNSSTQKHCCFTLYSFELMLDGVSYGKAYAVSPGP